MRGLPKFFNSKQDYLNCLTIDTLKEATKAELQKLIDNRFNWFDVSVLADDETGLNDDTHRVINGMQQELKEDPTSTIFRLGFTVQEVEGLINA